MIKDNFTDTDVRTLAAKEKLVSNAAPGRLMQRLGTQRRSTMSVSPAPAIRKTKAQVMKEQLAQKQRENQQATGTAIPMGFDGRPPAP